MKAGNFNMHDYLEKLNEAAEEAEAKEQKGLGTTEGLIMPDENKKIYNWLKKEYNAGKTEVKVEINMGGAKFEPGYDLQTDLKSVKDFKPGMFGEVKTTDTGKGGESDSENDNKSTNLNKTPNPNVNTAKPAAARPGAPAAKPAAPFAKKGETPETSDKKPNINNKEGKEKSENDDKTSVKKVDLKTKKK